MASVFSFGSSSKCKKYWDGLVPPDLTACRSAGLRRINPSMLNLDDKRWTELKGGYRVPFDPRQLLRRLESGTDIQGCWQELWQGLYHQGDVGEASYAAVPHLVRIYQNRGKIDWNTYAIVTSIELARNVGKNPDVPLWLRLGYEEAINRLAMTGLGELPHANDKETIRSILAVLAIWKKARTYARIIIDFSEDALNELENKGSTGDK